jgi:hypothetical protein
MEAAFAMMRRSVLRLSFGRKLQLAAIGIAAVAGSVLFVLENAIAIRAQSPPTAAVHGEQDS